MKLLKIVQTLIGGGVMLSIAPLAAQAQLHPIPSPGTEGLRVIVGNTDPVVATYQGSSADFSNDLYLMLDSFGRPGDDGDFSNDIFVFNNKTTPVGETLSLGTFDPGTELLFRLFVNDTGYNFFTGAASLNPDNQTHARVQANWQPNESLVGFEDYLYGSGAADSYYDLSFSLSNTTSSQVPEPMTILGTLAFGTLGGSVWRKRKSQKAS